MSGPFEIRKDPGKASFMLSPGKGIFGALLMFAVAAILGYLALKAVEYGSGLRAELVGGGLALCRLAPGIRRWRSASDRSVQVVLDSEGFRDRRGGNVLVPWADVREASYHSVRRFKMIVFKLAGPVPPAIRYTLGLGAPAMAMPW